MYDNMYAFILRFEPICLIDYLIKVKLIRSQLGRVEKVDTNPRYAMNQTKINDRN